MEKRLFDHVFKKVGGRCMGLIPKLKNMFVIFLKAFYIFNILLYGDKLKRKTLYILFGNVIIKKKRIPLFMLQD